MLNYELKEIEKQQPALSFFFFYYNFTCSSKFRATKYPKIFPKNPLTRGT